MRKIERARELLAPQEIAVVVFTHGLHFLLHSNGAGDIGNWSLDPQAVEAVDKVVIYCRDERRGTTKVFLGSYTGLRPSLEKGRCLICFSRLREVGTTDRPWFDFADGSQNPLCYIEG